MNLYNLSYSKVVFLSAENGLFRVVSFFFNKQEQVRDRDETCLNVFSKLVGLIAMIELYLEKRRERCVQVARQLHTNIRT